MVRRNDLIDTNPAAGIRPPTKYVPRDRVLSDAELAAMWRAADKVSGRVGAFVKLLILTGCRKSEIGALEWAEITTDAIELAAERTKTGVRHSVPLTPLMRAIIEAQPNGGRYVFGPIPSGGPWAKRKIDVYLNGADIAPWTLHDLRRSFVTGLARLGVAPHVIERCVNHKLGGIAGIYQRHDFAVEVREAFELWSRHVASLC
jgi:integrase